MRSIKKIFISICMFSFIPTFFYAQTGNITVNLKNINGNSTPYPGANGKVYLYDSSYNIITFKNTDSAGTTKFTNQPYGTYYLESYHNANPPTIFGSEYWGSASVNHRSSETILNLTRYLPYYSYCKVFINSTNAEVTGSTVSSGIQLRIEVTFNNPNSTSRTIKGRIVIDRNKITNYDSDQTSTASAINGNGNLKFTFLYTPSNAGSYYGASGTITNVNGNYILTDGTGWFSNPLFTIVPPPPALSSPADLAKDISTTPTLNWSSSPGAVSYQVQVSATSSFTNLIFNQSNISGTSVIVTPSLSDITTYYWRVNASNLGGTSNWSTTRSFTTTISETKNSTIDFSGLKWNVSDGYSGPGPNNWFNGINSVWIDNAGSLHLKIRKIGDKWYCSGITSQDTMGYGEYSFSVSSDVELYDPNIIVGLFIYENDTKEIDIEFSRWGDALSNAGWFVIQPANGLSSNSFSLNLQGRPSYHKFIWTKGNVKFQSYLSSGELIKEWTYRGSNIPVPNQMKPHINFWLMSGLNPKNLSEAEFVISNFKFTPALLLDVESKNREVPKEYQLFQNYPNPFNPSTVISWQLTVGSFVSLKIFDLLGREVATLVNEFQQPGKYEKTFDGTSLPSGIYFYKLQTDEFTQTKKMILLK